MGSKNELILVILPLVCAIFSSTLATAALQSAIAQQQEETSSSGEEENFARGIVSDVLEDGGNDDEEIDGGAEDQSNQDATNTAATEDSNQVQDVDQGDISTFGDDAADIDDANVAAPIAAPIDVDVDEAPLEEDEELSTTPPPPPPSDDSELPLECALEITTDKEIYEPEDVVAITITNTGDEPIDFPNSALGLEIRNVDTGEAFPLDAAQVVTTLEPGESRTFEFTYEELVSEIETGLISATVVSECGGVKEVTFRLSVAPPPEEGGKIVFASIRDSNFEIYVMNADGSDQHNISNNPAEDAYPSWSPDGTKIAFSSTRDGNHEIYVMNADGSDPQRLTDNTADDISPDWGPDGTKIAFSSNRGPFPSPYRIYVMNADGSDQHNITPPTAENEYNYYPSWSPDGTKIAFSSTRPNGGFEIFTMNADGSDERRLTNDPFLDVEPSWSPDGTKIAFETDRDPPRHPRQIYVMNADGSDQHNISNNPDDSDLSPDWGPATDTVP